MADRCTGIKARRNIHKNKSINNRKIKRTPMIDIKHPTDMFHVKITFEDTFSFAKVTKEITVSGLTLSNMQKDIGKVVINRFNKDTQIREILTLKSIERL